MRTKFDAENFLGGPGQFFPQTNMLGLTQTKIIFFMVVSKKKIFFYSNVLSSLFLLLYRPKNVSLSMMCKTRSITYPRTKKSRVSNV